MFKYIRPLLEREYWLDLTPPPLVPVVFRILGISLAVLFLCGVVVRVIAGRKRKNPPLYRILVRIGRAVITLAGLGAAFFFFTYEDVYALSARFWWPLILLGGIVWAVFIVRDVMKRFPLETSGFAERQRREKYLPK